MLEGPTYPQIMEALVAAIRLEYGSRQAVRHKSSGNSMVVESGSNHPIENVSGDPGRRQSSWKSIIGGESS